MAQVASELSDELHRLNEQISKLFKHIHEDAPDCGHRFYKNLDIKEQKMINTHMSAMYKYSKVLKRRIKYLIR